jgi:radical SAM superfamily enzyme YgiQ (UPF0313 family)
MNLFKPKKVLFILKEMKMEYLGVMYLISSLKKAGHIPYLLRADKDTSIMHLIAIMKPDFICYSVCSGAENYYFTLDNEIRKQLPYLDYKSVYGGPSATFSPELFISKTSIKGEAEVALIDLINDGSFQDLKLIDVNQIPPPDRELVYSYPELRQNPIKNMITRRGCRFGCTYCFNRTWNKIHNTPAKDIVRVRNIEDVITEAMEIKENWQPVEMIHIMDDNFAQPIEWLKTFSTLWKKHVNLPFICNINPKDITEEVLQLLADADCHIITLSIEAANDQNRRNIFNRTADKSTVTNAIQLCKKFNIRTRLNNIIGLPVPNSLKDAYETLDFNLACQPTTSWCALLQCYRGTKIFEIAQENGFAPDDGSVDEGFFGISTLKLQNKKYIERLHKLWPLITNYPIPFRFLTPLLIRIPLPLKWYIKLFNLVKQKTTERDLWKVYTKK